MQQYLVQSIYLDDLEVETNKMYTQGYKVVSVHAFIKSQFDSGFVQVLFEKLNK
jgi:hypothetical protein